MHAVCKDVFYIHYFVCNWKNVLPSLCVLCNFAGDVVLQDLVLKQSALDDLDLPVKTVYGTLGIQILY